jgi:hypothetical protein
MNSWIKAQLITLLLAMSAPLYAQDSTGSEAGVPNREEQRNKDDAPPDALAPEEWRRLDAAVDRALAWLASRQRPDGSFPTLVQGQPGVTSLCVLAFMAHGHNPGNGLYGERLKRATDFIMSCQKPNGLVALYAPAGSRISRNVGETIGVTAAYNHAIGSLALSETYGMGQVADMEQMQRAIDKSLAATLEMQRWRKDRAVDRGGWRYVYDYDTTDSDLSITGWHLMFLRSARNAGFAVPKESIDDAVAYIRRTFDKSVGVFRYTTREHDSISRAMAGAGILALAHAGAHHSSEAQQSGQWLLEHSFNEYNGNNGIRLDRYHYSLFNASHAMYQLGSPFWEQFFPPTVAALLDHQNADGSWDAESFHRDRVYGNCYSTALVVLSLGVPNQLLPVFQR